MFDEMPRNSSKKNRAFSAFSIKSAKENCLPPLITSCLCIKPDPNLPGNGKSFSAKLALHLQYVAVVKTHPSKSISSSLTIRKKKTRRKVSAARKEAAAAAVRN